MSAIGETYMFGLYSADIKSSLGYDQTTFNLLRFLKDLGANIRILSSLINEVTPPYVVLSVGPIYSPSPIPSPWSCELKTSPRAEESCLDSLRASLVLVAQSLHRFITLFMVTTPSP
ncbi:hypothetical protein LguiB_013803 [Lonicera macranthoides]